MTNIYIKMYPKGVIIVIAIIEVRGQNAQTANESFLKVIFFLINLIFLVFKIKFDYNQLLKFR